MTQEIDTALRAGARGSYPDEAAVELLIRHDSWLRRADFLARFVIVETGEQVAAYVDWARAVRGTAEWPMSPPERSILAICASLAGHPSPEASRESQWTPVPLRWALAGLDRRNVALVLAAVSHAGGSHHHVEHLAVDLPNGATAVTNASPRINLGPLFDWPESLG